MRQTNQELLDRLRKLWTYYKESPQCSLNDYVSANTFLSFHSSDTADKVLINVFVLFSNFFSCACGFLCAPHPIDREEITDLQTNFEFLTNKINSNSHKEIESNVTYLSPTNINENLTNPTNIGLEVESNYDNYDIAPQQIQQQSQYLDDSDYNNSNYAENIDSQNIISVNVPLSSPKDTINPEENYYQVNNSNNLPNTQIYSEPGKLY